MAYSTGSYANVDDALDLLRAFCLAYGWTINDYSAVGSRYRLHIQKTINGNTCYFNFKSCVAEVPFTLSGYATLTGIACNGSLGYTGASAWNTQPGFTNIVYASPGTSFNVGGNITLDNSGGTYFFFDNGSTVSATFTSNRSTAPYQHMAFGATDLGVPVFACSGGLFTDFSASMDTRGAFLATSRTGVSNVPAYQSAAFDGTGWCAQGYVNSGVARLLASQVQGNTNVSTEVGQYAQTYIRYSPSPIRGNAPLPPCVLNITKNVAGDFYPIGTLAGVFFINMTNYSSEDEIVLSTGTYKIFRINTISLSGVAFKK